MLFNTHRDLIVKSPEFENLIVDIITQMVPAIHDNCKFTEYI